MRVLILKQILHIMAFRYTKAKVKKDYLQALPGDHRLHKGAQRHQRQFGQGEPDPHA